MKKIMLILCFFATLPAIATEMCARNDTAVIPLDATVNGTGGGFNSTESIWWADFPYGRIYGLSTCLSTDEGNKIKNSKDQILPNDERLSGLSGTDADGNVRLHCWCKMTHPMSSLWVYNLYLGNDCGSRCSSYCVPYTGGAVTFRSSLFSTVGK